MTAIDEYINYQLEAESKYGPNTIVFFENGTFYEVYGVDNDKEKVGQPKRIGEILNIAITRKNKKILENSRKNPLMVGVPTAHSERHIKSLIASGFTIVFVEQTTIPPNPERAITHVLSPTTYIADEYRTENNYVLSIYFDTEKSNLGVGMCAYDLTTGDGIFYQTFITNKEVVLEEVYRFMEAIDPKEIIINMENCEIPFPEIKDHLELYRHQFYIRELKKDYFKIGYQNQILTKVFPDEKSMLSPIERLNLEFQSLSTLAIMLALDFIFDHDERILRSLNRPREWEEKKHLILNNNTLYQLNIVCDGSQGNAKSLLDIINCTKTIMGKRALKNWMLNPIICPVTLEKKYKLLEKIMEKQLWKAYDRDLSMVIDLERFFRKMSIGYLLPHELSSFEISLDAIKNIIERSQSDFTELDNNFIDIYSIGEETKTKFLQFYEKYFNTFDLNIMAKFCMNDINQSFFKIGVEPELDEIQQKIIKERDFFEKEATRLSKLIDVADAIKFDHNDRDGYFLRTTSKRGELLEKKLGKGSVKNTGANVCRVIDKKLEESNLRLRKAEADIRDNVRNCFIKWCEREYRENHEIFTIIIKFIATIDMVLNQGKICKENCYNRPIIAKKGNNSYFNAKGLRHPIIEKITETLYVPNDIEIDGTGILLYGLNGGGKSSLLKAVGLATVMAQMGMFVPADNLTFFPFKTLYTRIMGNDNIFRGLSSFALEMIELKTILQYSNERSLILGDEICRGTEIHSALSIVSSAVSVLCKKRTNFLFATHLHKLHEIDVVKSCPNLRHFYIDLTMENGKLIFGRRIYEGIGRKLYGLEVAEHIVEHEEFLALANKVRRQLLEQENTEIVSTKKSQYNQEIYVDKCEVCDEPSKKETLEVHHVNSQKFADCDGSIDFFNKNHKGNLVVLCHEHHNKVHQGEIILNGWVETLEGRKLDWSEKEIKSTARVHVVEKKEGLEEEVRNKIKSYEYLTKNLSLRTIKEKIKKDTQINVSIQQLKQIFNC